MGTLDRATLEQDYYSRSSPLEALKLGVSVKKKKNTENKKRLNSQDYIFGVPVVAQSLTNLTRNHEVAGLIPGLAQWVKDLALP